MGDGPRTDAEIMEILANTVSILIPCFNPDGNIIVADWYAETLGTEYEGVGPPTLYHHYIGHDNNRDAFMQNTVESQYGAQILFRDWTPQGYIDHHQMGGYTARIFLPPYAEPIRPEADPIVWREMSWYGAQMAYEMEEQDLPGAVNSAINSGWGHFGFHWITQGDGVSPVIRWPSCVAPALTGAVRSRLVRGLKGAEAGGLAVEPPGNFERVFNLETAKVRRPTMTSPVLPRADELIPWQAPACAGHAGAAADTPPG